MTVSEPLEFECDRCGYRETLEDALQTVCERCGGEMRNVIVIS